MKLRFALVVWVSLFAAKVWADDTGQYSVVKTETLGGEGGWDYLAVDADLRHLYISRGSRIDVVDADSLKKIGEISDTPNVHGIAWDKESGHGFTSNRGDPSVTMFDIKTLKVIKKIPVTGKPDGIFFEPFTKHIFVESHSDPNETVINAADGTVLGTIDLGGEPEQGASDGNGHVYINLESTSEVVVVDPTAMKVTARYKLGEGEEPSGMGLDAKNRRIFSCCGNAKMVVLDADSGNILATLPTGQRTDAGTFDPDTMEAFSSNGDGTLTVVKENSPTSFTVEQNVQTQIGARTCALDAKTHNVILVTAKFEAPATAPSAAPAAQPAEGGRRRRPRMIPGSFTILVVGKSS
jgi:DNA-binding beta-propeller fold protein YncE